MKNNIFRLTLDSDRWFSIKLYLFGLLPLNLKQLRNLRVSTHGNYWVLGSKMQERHKIDVYNNIKVLDSELLLKPHDLVLVELQRIIWN